MPQCYVLGLFLDSVESYLHIPVPSLNHLDGRGGGEKFEDLFHVDLLRGAGEGAVAEDRAERLALGDAQAPPRLCGSRARRAASRP